LLEEATLATSSTLERELFAEQAYVDLVLTHLRQAVISAKGLATESEARYTSDRESWVREEDGTALFERDAFAFLAARRLATLAGEHEGLVFGRLDCADQEKRYIGRLGVRTPDYEPLVIDWRAAAAEPFYRATPVDAMGVVRRRVLTSRDDVVTDIEDDVLTPGAVPADMVVIGDGALMRALGRARGPHMLDIVATIQAEQDKVIRAPYPGFTLITGGPGTGKTVVGLHRIAFLLYTHRRRFTNGGVLVIGPSAVFMDYIERVLPSLGEDAVTLRSLGQVAEDVLGLTTSHRGSAESAMIKGSLTMVDLLERLVEEPAEKLDPPVVTVKGEPLTITAPELARIRRDCLAREPYNLARTNAERAVVSVLAAAGQAILDQEEPAAVEKAIQNSWALARFMDQWWPPLEPVEVLARLSDPDLVEHLSDLTDHDAVTLASAIDPAHWTVGDIALLDELATLLGPAPVLDDAESIFDSTDTDELVTISERLTDVRSLEAGTVHATYAHILVDEAQDVTPMQWRMIHRRGVNASWTIIGDPAQSGWPDRTEPAQALDQLIGSRERRSFRLSTNYRSPQEAYDLATAYIRRTEPDADIPQAVRSTGVSPRLLVAPRAGLGASLAGTATHLLTEVEGTIGVIAEPFHADLIAQWLPPDPRVILLDPYSSKGLEFDAVVVVDPDSIAAASVAGPRTLYVALTRPTQILVTIDIDSPGSWRAGLISA